MVDNMEDTKTNIEEQNFRINIQQSAKGYSYFEITCRGQTPEEIAQRLNEAVAIAQKKCNELNGTFVGQC